MKVSSEIQRHERLSLSEIERLAVDVLEQIVKGSPQLEQCHQLLAVLDTLHELANQDRGYHITKRELYYCHVTTFRSQRLCDDVVQKLCRILKCPPHSLGIVSVPRGLIRGCIKIRERNAGNAGEIIEVDGMSIFEPRGHAVPQIDNLVSMHVPSNAIVLVVEKETVFYRLLNDKIFERFGHPLVLVTARGMPDLPTRHLLRNLRQKIFVLVDYDPYGMEIANTYIFGTDDAWHQQDLAIEAELIALDFTTAKKWGLKIHQMLRLAPRDQAKTKSLLKRLESNTSVSAGVMKLALQNMMDTDKKYEIDTLKLVDMLSAYLTEYLEDSQGP